MRREMKQEALMPREEQMSPPRGDDVETELPSTWLRTGSVYDWVLHDAPTVRVLVMRYWPRGIGRVAVHEWLPWLAPSHDLLRVEQKQTLSWTTFADCYREELDSNLGAAGRTEVLARLDQLRRMHQLPTVTLLCGERAPAGDERLVACHRRLLRDWLLDELT